MQNTQKNAKHEKELLKTQSFCAILQKQGKFHGLPGQFLGMEKALVFAGGGGGRTASAPALSGTV